MRGIDVSFSKITPQWAANRKAEGYEVFVQCAWTGGLAGNPGIKAVCENNLRCAREAGLISCAYVNASPPDWWSLPIQMNKIEANCGDEWERLLWVFMDVEIAGTTYERAAELAQHVGIESGHICNTLYSAKWFWNTLPSKNDPRWKARFPNLWNAFYDSNPDIDFPTSPYGLWQIADLMGEQYQNTTVLEGVAVDLNTFRDSYFSTEDELALTERQSQTLEKLAQWTLEPYTVTWPNGATQTFPSKLDFLMAHTTSFDQHRIDWLQGQA